jgi:hypothetical protein
VRRWWWGFLISNFVTCLLRLGWNGCFSQRRLLDTWGGIRKVYVRMTNTLFQGWSTATSRPAEIMKHIDLSLVGRTVYFQRDEVILLFSYYFARRIYWFLFIPFFRMRRAPGGKRRWRM